MYIQRSTELPPCNSCCRRQAISTAYSDNMFVALGILHAMFMRRIFIRDLSGSTIFFMLSHKRYDLKKNSNNTTRVFRFCLQHLSENFLILRRTERDEAINVYWSSRKVPVILVRFKWSLNFLAYCMKIHPVGAELFHADERTDDQTDMTKVIFALRKCAKAPKYYTILELFLFS
jgi:hypothetical protein